MTVPYYVESAESASAWNYCTLGDQILPGICRVSVRTRWQLSVGEPSSSDGGNIDPKGRSPREITIELSLQPETSDSLSDLQLFIKNLNGFVGGKSTSPLAISHPQTDMFGIDLVYVTDFISPPPRTGVPWIMTLTCLEYLPPKPVKKGSPKRKSRLGQGTLSAYPPIGRDGIEVTP